MALMPNHINGIPISARTQWLLFAPISWLLNPKVMLVESTPIHDSNWLLDMLRKPRSEPMPTVFKVR